MSISTNDLKNGMALNLPEGLVTVVEFQHVKPGKGGAFVRTKLKNVRTGAVVDKTFRADEKVEHAVIDKREMQYLYREGNDYVFMDNESYDQLQVAADRRSATRPSTSRRATPRCCRCTTARSLGVDLPAAVELDGRSRPSPACRATGCRARASRRRSRPGSSCRCRCSSRPARSSRSTRAPATISTPRVAQTTWHLAESPENEHWASATSSRRATSPWRSCSPTCRSSRTRTRSSC